MFNYRIKAVINREIKTKIATKAFIFSTLSFPLMMALMIGINVFIAMYEGDSGTKLAIVASSEEQTTMLRQEFEKRDFVKDSTYVISYYTIPSENFDAEFKVFKKQLIDGKINSLIKINDDSFQKKAVSLYSANAKNLTLEDKISGALNTVFIGKYFESKNISGDDIDFAKSRVDFSNLKISEDEEIKEENGGQLALAYVFLFMLYISLLMMGSMLMQAVIEEKQNRIIEVILSSMKAQEFMIGKIAGNVIVSLLQMAIWLSPILIIVGFSLPVLPKEIIITINWLQIVYFFINFMLGLVIFLGLFATIGSIYDSPQDAQSGVWPVMMLIIIPFVLSFTLIKNPSNSMGTILSFCPFTNIMVMPVKMTLVDVAWYELVGAMIVNLLTIYFIFPLAGKIYRIGVLITGKKPSLKEVIGWLKLSN